MHRDKPLWLHVGHIGAVCAVHADAKATADIADNGVARHWVAALGKTHEHAVHTRDTHALALTGGGFFAFLNRRCSRFGSGRCLWMQHGIQPIKHLARRGVGIAHGGHKVVHAVKIHFLSHNGQVPILSSSAHIQADLAAFFFEQVAAQ